MAVTFFNATATSGAASAGSRTVTIVGTANACLVVFTHANSTISISAMACGLRPMSRLGLVSAGGCVQEMWGLSDVPTGTLTISAIPVGAGITTRWCMAAAVYTGQRQVGGSCFGTFTGASASGATVNFSISSTTTDLVAFGFGVSSNSALVINNGNTRASATVSTGGRLAIGDIAGAPTVSVSASSSASAVFGMLGAPIVASAAAPTTTLKFDNAAVSGVNSTNNTFSMLLTATSNAVLLVFINTSVQAGGQTISSVAINGTQLTNLGRVDYHGNAVSTELWGLTAPPAGVLTISAAAVGTNTVAWNMAAVTYTGHKTATGGPFGGVGVSSATGVNQTNCSVSSTAGDLTIFGFGNWMFDPVSVSVGTAFTQRQAPFQFPCVLVAETIGAPSITGSAQASSAVDWGVVGIRLIQAGANTFISANAAFTDAPDNFTASAQIIITSRLSATDAPDKFTASAQVRVTAALAATDAPDKFTASAQVRVTANFIATDNRDTFAGTANVVVSSRLSATDAQDKFSASAQIIVTARVSATDAQDIFSASVHVVGNNYITANLIATDAPDIFSASGQVIVTSRLSATDQQDIFAANANLVLSADAVVTAPPVTAGGHGHYQPADDEFWQVREAYLRGLQSAIEEPSPIAEPAHSPELPTETVTALSKPFLLYPTYQARRQEVIAALPQSPDMRQLYQNARRLRRINARIAQYKAIDAEAARQAFERQARREERARQRNRAVRKVKLLAATEAARLAKSIVFLTRTKP